ncbi:MAG: hypothetical protein JW908_03725 [Anaerolineales bacterium]|nr:hypothetical protein [Anaerolineales bacterium]
MTHHHKHRTLFALFITLSMAIGLITLAHATPGDLDTSFDSDGIVEASFSGNPAVFNGIVVQPDNKIIAVGFKDQNSDWAAPVDVVMARYSEDGSLDTTFGTSGIYTASINGTDGRFYAAALQPDGKIIVVGYSVSGGNKAFLVTRFTADGALDTTFGSSGMTYSSFGAGDDQAYDVAIQEDGKIVVAGSAESTTLLYDFVIARYTDAGVLDTTFNPGGTPGYAIVPLQSDARDYAKHVAIQSDGKIVATGPVETGNFSNIYNMATIRLTSAGALDTTFNSTGIAAYYGSDSADTCGGMEIQNDGKIVMAAVVGSSNIGAIRYTTAGAVDTTFSPADSGSTDIVKDAALQPDGKLVVTGFKNETGYTWDPFVVRYNTDGTLDTTFSGDGLAYTNLGTNTDYGLAVAVQPDGQIVVAGYKSSGGYAAILLRYDTRVTGTATVGTSETPIGSTNVSAQVPSGSCEVTAIKKNAFPGGTADDGEMPAVWDITGTGCSFPMTLEFCYSDAELANAMNVTESSLAVFKYNDGSGSWISQGGTVNTGSNCVTLTGVSALSDWTLGDTTTSGNSGPTAVALDSFSGQARKMVPWLLVGSFVLLLLWTIYKQHSQA